MAHTEIDWLGLAIRSESDQPHEFLAIGWTIRNRVWARRFPNTYRDVILQRKQFSYFNAWTGYPDKPEAIWEKAVQGYAGGPGLDAATECAAHVIAAPAWAAPFGPDVLHYYSPVSMKPKGSAPPWAKTAKRLFTPSGIDPARFVYAAGVP